MEERFYQHDLKKLPSYAEFEYKHTKCIIKRNKIYGTLEGNIDISKFNFSEHDIKKLNDSVHGGLLNRNGNIIGFECRGVNDYVPLFGIVKVGPILYKDKEWVSTKIKNIVDYAISIKKID